MKLQENLIDFQEILARSFSFHPELELGPELFMKLVGMVSIYLASHQNGSYPVYFVLLMGMNHFICQFLSLKVDEK